MEANHALQDPQETLPHHQVQNQANAPQRKDTAMSGSKKEDTSTSVWPETEEVLEELETSVGPVHQAHPTLSAVQVQAAYVMARLAPDATRQEMADVAGVSRSSLHRWWQLPEFRRLVREQSASYLETQIPRAHKGLMKAVDRGVPKALELFYRLAGVLREQDRLDSLSEWFQTLGDCGSEACVTIVQAQVRRQGGASLEALGPLVNRGSIQESRRVLPDGEECEPDRGVGQLSDNALGI